MNWWELLIFVTLTWLVWVIACFTQLWADKLQGKRPQDAGNSIVPGIPLFPLAAMGIAMGLNHQDRITHSLGTKLIGGFHLLLLVVFSAGVVREICRGRSEKRSENSEDGNSEGDMHA